MKHRQHQILTIALSLIALAIAASTAASDPEPMAYSPPKPKMKILLTSMLAENDDPSKPHFSVDECILIKQIGAAGSTDKYQVLSLGADPKLDCEAPAWQVGTYIATQDYPMSSSYTILNAMYKVPGEHTNPTDHTLQMIVNGRVNGKDDGLPNDVEIWITDEHHDQQAEGGPEHPGHGQYK